MVECDYIAAIMGRRRADDYSATVDFTVMHFRVEPGVYDRLKAQAKVEKRTINNLLSVLVEQAIVLREKSHPKG